MAHMLGIKFGSLLIKTLTKPMANSIKRQAANPGIIRQACLRYGQFHHQVESRLSLRLVGHSAKRVKDMQEEDAVQLGATMISEAFIFATAGALLWWELSRKSREDSKAKEEKERKEREREERMEQRFNEVVAMVAKEHEERERMREEMEEMRNKLTKRWL